MEHMEELKPNYYFSDLGSEPFDKIFSGVDTVWEALSKKNEFLESMQAKILGTVEDGVKIDGKVFIGEGSVVEAGVVIKGPVYIGKNCTIGPHAYIRAGTVIGNNVKIGRPEIKNSIIFDGVDAHHHGYIGDSIVGARVNIATGVEFLNLRHDDKEVVVKIGDEKISPGLRKFGAIVGDGCKLGGKCVLNPGTFVGKNCWTWPNIVLKGFYPSNKIIKSAGEVVDKL